MASIRKHGKGWQAQVAMRGIRRSRKFTTRAEAKDWAAREEYLIKEGEGQYGPGSLRDIFERYSREVSVTKRGARWEQIRLAKIGKDKLGDVLVKDVRSGDFADWRDRRLKEVGPASVKREMILLSSVMNRARKEWGLLTFNPLKDVERPKEPPARERRVTDAEIAKLVEAAGTDMRRKQARAVLAFRFAVETAMRAGEIASLTRSEVSGSVAHLSMTKNGTPRDVPLSSAALAILEEVPGDALFDISSRDMDVYFRKARDSAKIKGLTFHDSRHEAITRMSRKIDVLALARIVGHKDIRMLQRYYFETAADLAGRLG